MAAPRFPSPSRYATADDFLEAVYKYMTRIAAAELYRHYKTGEVLPTEEELAEWIGVQVWPKVRTYVTDYQESRSKGRWDGDAYERQLDRAAAFCLDTYDPEPIHARAVKGGQRSRRTARWTFEDLIPLRGMSARQQMAALNIKSPTTIKKLRRQLQERTTSDGYVLPPAPDHPQTPPAPAGAIDSLLD